MDGEESWTDVETKKTKKPRNGICMHFLLFFLGKKRDTFLARITVIGWSLMSSRLVRVDEALVAIVHFNTPSQYLLLA